MAKLQVSEDLYRELRASLPPQLPGFLSKQRWFGGKARQVVAADLADVIPVPADNTDVLLLVAAVKYADGAKETYAVPMRCAREGAAPGPNDYVSLRVAEPGSGTTLLLTDALTDEGFLRTLLALIERKATIVGQNGELRALQTTEYSRLHPSSADVLQPKPVRAEQSNSSIMYGDRLILKFFRRLEEGINPDLEIGVFLTEKVHFSHIPQLAGSLEYHSSEGWQAAQGILQAFVPNQGDAWSYTLSSLNDFYHEAGNHSLENHSGTGARDSLSQHARQLVDKYLASAELLGRRTAEMHFALASAPDDSTFCPEPFTMDFQQALEGSMRELVSRVFRQLRERNASLPTQWRGRAEEIGRREEEIAHRLDSALRRPIHAMRTRIHGDYHLGQVLYTGSDFVIIDFEGEPARPLVERRTKRSPLQDVAGMLRSFHYAAFAPLLAPVGDKSFSAEKTAILGAWVEVWNTWVADRFMSSYFETAANAPYLPPSHEEVRKVLELHLLEKAVYELGYELNNRPTWVGIPLQGISRLLSI